HGAMRQAAPDEPGECRIVSRPAADDHRYGPRLGGRRADDAAGDEPQQPPVRGDEPLQCLPREVRRIVEDAGHLADSARFTFWMRSIRAITRSSSARSKTFFQSSVMIASRP